MPPISANVSTSVASRSGDASSGLNTPLQYNGQFIVGGSGSTSGTTAAADNGAGGTGLGAGGALGGNLPLYLGIGAAALVAVIALSLYARR